jgi:hypothetical protein
MMVVRKMTIVLLKTSFGRIWKTIGDKGKVSRAVLELKVLRNVTEIVDVFESFFNEELIDTIVTETNRYMKQFLRGRELSVRSPTRAWSL